MAEPYSAFAPLYSRGPYTRYSQRMAELLPEVLAEFSASPQRLLDLACGEGSFAVAMAARLPQVTGVDRSPQMLELARARGRACGVTVDFQQHDLTRLPFQSTFDLVTCWFDSLNYLLELSDLELAFDGAARALRPGGLFIFDMTTRCGLQANWHGQTSLVEQDTAEVFIVHRLGYDFERDLASVQITAFVRQAAGGLWQRIDEQHQQRAYPIAQMRAALARAGFTELACWGNLGERAALQADSRRAWFVMQKD
jgi:SAM-dependent methyltransferase